MSVPTAIAPFVLLATGSAPEFETRPLELVVALVEDPDFPPLRESTIKTAAAHARSQFSLRFGVSPPKLDVRYRFPAARFIDVYANPRDANCRPRFEARYRGTGPGELKPFRSKAVRFFRQWQIADLAHFAPPSRREHLTSYDQLYEHYVTHYTQAFDRLKEMKTPAGTPLLRPRQQLERSFVAWLCALARQDAYDVIVTNTFIASDLMSEPFPHSVLGKVKIGGVAAPSPARTALGGQALMATTFGIDTPIETLSELSGAKPTEALRAEVLGKYLIAHEIAHAVFGIPDVYDHPPGCLMTSRPGASYRDGLDELTRHVVRCPRCRPYVQARSLYDRGLTALENKEPKKAARLFARAARTTPKHFHGSRRRWMSKITLGAARAQQALGATKKARRYAQLALRLDPQSSPARDLLVAKPRPRSSTPRRVNRALALPPTTHTASTATTALNR